MFLIRSSNLRQHRSRRARQSRQLPVTLISK